MKEKIEATPGKILTNGEIYGRVIYLGAGLKKEDFREITEEEYERITAEENDADQGEN